MEQNLRFNRKQLESFLDKLKDVNWLSDDTCRVMGRLDHEGRKKQVLVTTPDYSSSLAQDWIALVDTPRIRTVSLMNKFTVI